MVFKEIFASPQNFGIGMTKSGGGRGMAALEGVVAALEVGQKENSDSFSALIFFR